MEQVFLLLWRFARRLLLWRQCFGRLVGEAACQGWVLLAVTSREKPGGMDGHQLLARLPAQPQAPGTEMAQDRSMCWFLLALPWHPPELLWVSHFQWTHSKQWLFCFWKGGTLVGFKISSLAYSTSRNRMSSVECGGEKILKYKKKEKIH